jgi:hypothetical protein
VQRLCGRHLCNACVKLKKESLLRLALFILVSTHKHTHAHNKQSHTEHRTHSHTHTLTHTHTHAHTHTRTHAHPRAHTLTHTHTHTHTQHDGAHKRIPAWSTHKAIVQSLCAEPLRKAHAQSLSGRPANSLVCFSFLGFDQFC